MAAVVARTTRVLNHTSLCSKHSLRPHSRSISSTSPRNSAIALYLSPSRGTPPPYISTPNPYLTHPTTTSPNPLHVSTPSIASFSTTTCAQAPPPPPAAAATATAAGSSPTDTAPTSLAAPDHLNDLEKDIFTALQDDLKPTALEVQDISGGCGSMYAISVTSDEFRGLSVIKQHRRVNAALGERVKGWHGVQIRTSVP